jgi:23S rRNA G2445 N2-methylase RlmL
MRARPRRRTRVSFRVVARKAGEHAFRRVDLQRAVELGILDRFPGWRLVEDGGLEVWAQLVKTLLVVAIRLSDNEMRQRAYRTISLPAALKPSVARGLVLLSEPRVDDVFLDPMCGSGTILIERALTGRYQLLLGGDIDEKAVAAACENIGPRYKPVEIRQWDARSLPLEDGSVTAIVTNLPFGKQIGSTSENRTLYPDLLVDWVRVLSPGGRMVLLTSEDRLMRRTLSGFSALHLGQRLRLLVRGQAATAYVIRSSSL